MPKISKGFRFSEDSLKIISGYKLIPGERKDNVRLEAIIEGMHKMTEYTKAEIKGIFSEDELNDLIKICSQDDFFTFKISPKIQLITKITNADKSKITNLLENKINNLTEFQAYTLMYMCCE